MDKRSGVMLSVIMVLVCMGMGAEAQTTINTTGCGMSKFCAAEPKSCDPAVPGTCFFMSAVNTGVQNFSFQLQAQSTGYIALGLSPAYPTGQNDTVYVCANNNNTFTFLSLINNNGTLNQTNTLPASLQYNSINGSTIGCVFSATVPNATARGSSTNFFVALYTGLMTNGFPGVPKAVFISTAAVDLSVPSANATNSLNAVNTTATPTTNTGHAFGQQRTLSQALLILLGGLGFFML